MSRLRFVYGSPCREAPGTPWRGFVLPGATRLSIGGVRRLDGLRLVTVYPGQLKSCARKRCPVISRAWSESR